MPSLVERYREVRARSVALASHLDHDDQLVQSMPSASPTKWHLAHTSWFFEHFVLRAANEAYVPVHPRYDYIFNSYYEAVGARHPREARSLITRPTLPEVHAYRTAIDERIEAYLEALAGASSEDKAASSEAGAPSLPDLRKVIRLGLEHEEQHQELILTDAKHALYLSPLRPTYRAFEASSASAPPPGWFAVDEGLYEVGHAGSGFAFDNETPRHRTFLESFELATRTVTNAEYLEFMKAGGYESPEHWVSDGWDMVRREGLKAPLYWDRVDGEWMVFTLGGDMLLQPTTPVCHLSWYEADAYARWKGARLPSEAEWEAVAAAIDEGSGHDNSDERLHPRPATRGEGPRDMYGSVWEHTASPYVAYPRFKPLEGALGEYNGKFMSGQMVLRGGSCLSSPGHVRATYRNFFPPDTRWQMSGIRLARWR